jgi:hypothetical protein
MSKKSIVLIVLVTSICWSSSSSAAVHPGAKCSKQNATTTISGKKYTCIKSGGKLVWNKGVLVKKGETLKAGVCPQPSAVDKSTGISVARANTLIGMKEGEAESCAAQLEWIYRVVSRDGEDFPATLDYRLDRVSVTIKNGVISRVDVG